ncbi:gliding motility-associated C-terminal domain-containing protein [Putridiphycobacter roseus]|nr:gliding motility-associated C-terminal domain-containing protein [Putridiphycobacter roseus]
MKQKVTLLVLFVLFLGQFNIQAQNASYAIDQGAGPFCENACITIQDLSTSPAGINSWTWTITPATATIQNPTSQDPGVICFADVGNYVLELDIIDGNGGIDDFNISMVVVTCPGSISAGFTFKDPICIDECVTMRDTSTGGPVTWDWKISPSDAIPSTSTLQNPEFCFPVAGQHTVSLQVTDINGSISAINNVPIDVVGRPSVTVSEDTIIELGTSIILTAQSFDATVYEWFPDENIRNPNNQNAFARPEISTEYIVLASDDNGCTNTDTIMVYVNFQPAIGVATAFSPNGDGLNDLLVVEGLALEKVIFKVFNRYGQLVFESVEQRNGWDGNFKGKPENPGVFIWTLEYEFNTGKTGKLSGNTTLVR